jgi:pimeloyl-ACP methyl ester carboxylesterase
MSTKLFYTSPAPIDPSKKTVVFLHAAYMSSTMWVDQIDYLKPAFSNTNLLLVDLNGHGKTRNGRKTFTLYDQVDDIVALMVFLERKLISGSIVDSLRCVRRYLHGLVDCLTHGS